jgi:hypothetical protein
MKGDKAFWKAGKGAMRLTLTKQNRRSRINETTASLSHYEEYTMFRLDAKIALITGSMLVIDWGWTAK